MRFLEIIITCQLRNALSIGTRRGEETHATKRAVLSCFKAVVPSVKDFLLGDMVSREIVRVRFMTWQRDYLV